MNPIRSSSLFLVAVLLALLQLIHPVRVVAQDAPPAPTPTLGRPILRFASTNHDFGRVVAGSVTKHAYAFTNTGNAVLQIQDVRVSCGCTTLDGWTRNIEPGQAGSIPIEFNSSRFKGPVTKTVVVQSNDTNQPQTVLRFTADVWNPVEAVPASISLNTSPSPTNPAVATFKIFNRQEQPFEITGVQSNHKLLTAEYRTIEPGKVFEITVKSPAVSGSGNVYGNIEVKTSFSQLPVINVPAWIVDRPAVSVIPATITLPPGPLVSNLTKTVAIRSGAVGSLSVFNPGFEGGKADISLKEVQGGRFFSVSVTFPAGFSVQAGKPSVVKLESNHPQFPKLTIPVVQTAQPASIPAASGANKS